jgi:hypothetical protein
VAELDPRTDPQNENRMVTVGYLNELYEKADRLAKLERWLAQMPNDVRRAAAPFDWMAEKPC